MVIQTPQRERKYLTIKELSNLTGFSVTQLRRMASAGRIPCHQPGGKGGKLLFSPDAIEKCGSSDSQSTPNDDLANRLSGRSPAWMDE